MVGAVFVDAGKEEWSEKEVRGIGPIDAGLRIHNSLHSYETDPFNSRNALVVGIGKFAGLGLFGTHRLTFLFRSPLSHGLHISTLGGAGYYWYRTGREVLVIKGKSRTPKIIMLTDEDIDFVVAPPKDDE